VIHSTVKSSNLPWQGALNGCGLMLWMRVLCAMPFLGYCRASRGVLSSLGLEIYDDQQSAKNV